MEDYIPWIAVGLMGAALLIALIVGIVRATKKYRVSFVAGCDFPVEGNLNPIVAKAGKAITLPAPTAKGARFAGWYFDEACSRKAYLSAMPRGGAALYGFWKEEKAPSQIPPKSSVANIRFNIGFDW